MYTFCKKLAEFIGRTSHQNLDRTAHFIAFLVFDLFRFRRKTVLRNLTLALGDLYPMQERIKLGRLSVVNFSRTVLEFLYAYTHDAAKDTTIEGQEHLDAALAKNTGAFIICAHIGNWETMGAKLASIYGKTWIPAKPIANKGINQFLTELREKQQFMPLKRIKKGDGFTAIKNALNANQIVGLVVDQTRPCSPKLPFFGQLCSTNISYAAIWRKVGFVPLIPAYIEREGFFKHHLKILPEIHPVITADETADILNHSTLFNQVAEQMIIQRPDLYFWLHKRFK